MDQSGNNRSSSVVTIEDVLKSYAAYGLDVKLAQNKRNPLELIFVTGEKAKKLGNFGMKTYYVGYTVKRVSINSTVLDTSNNTGEEIDATLFDKVAFNNNYKFVDTPTVLTDEPNLVPENIKAGVTIYGVEGTYEGESEETEPEVTEPTGD